MNPQVGDIWEWTGNRWDPCSLTSYTFKYVVLILTKPRHHYGRDGWDFHGLELDGDEPGAIQEWVINERDHKMWRQLA